jgi:choline dehydrogenase-like flavoprotein
MRGQQQLFATMTFATLDLFEASTLEAAVCIIGAGAAGITLACELDGSGLQVLLLEAGGLRADAALTDYYGGSASPPHPDPTQFRRTIFGGTTGIWGGRCVAYDPVDLLRREHVPNSGWPIGYEELARYYPRAMSYCDAGEFDFTIGTSLRDPAPTIGGFTGDENILADRIERYSWPTNFGTRYRKKMEGSRNVTAVLGARCLRLIKAGGEDRIAAAELIDGAGRRRTVQAHIFILATGGIEVPRLLLLSDTEGGGFGNQGDALGRYYMCHFENTVGRIVPRATKVAFEFERTIDGVYCRRQLRFTPEALERHRLLNMAFRLHFPNYSDASHGSSVMSGIYLAKSMLIPEYRAILQHSTDSPPAPMAAHLRNVALGLPQLLKFGGDWLFKIQLAQRKLPYTLVPNADGSYPLEFNSEQIPLASNRVTLADDVDRHRLRRVRVTWRVSEEDADAAFRGFLLLRESLNRSGACELQFDDRELRERLGRSMPLGGHHIGTARMATSPREGVVDGNCAVFGLPNLFVASSAVFPTSSHANPTLTIVALAVRLATHVKSRLATSFQ